MSKSMDMAECLNAVTKMLLKYSIFQALTNVLKNHATR